MAYKISDTCPHVVAHMSNVMALVKGHHGGYEASLLLSTMVVGGERGTDILMEHE